MTKPTKLAVIRARHESAAPPVDDRPFIDLFMVGSNSVLRYWEDTTRKHLDFVDSALMPWVVVSLGDDVSRAKQAELAIDALRAKFPGSDPLAGFQGVVVLMYPGTRQIPNPKAGLPGEPATIAQNFDAGATTVRGFPVAVIAAATGNHTFMCHEVGHVLGFEHSYGLLNNGADWDPKDATIVADPVYGSPFDLMSSASFGSRWLGTGPLWRSTPTRSIPAVTGWPTPGAFGSAGPNLSRAHLHRQLPDAMAGSVVERPFPTSGPVSVRLRSASADVARQGSGRQPTLLILHPAGEPASGLGRIYVEFRTATGWDAGLDPVGTDLSREGVVVHSLTDVPGTGPRIWYRGVVPLNSIDTDVAVDSSNLTVTIVGVDPDRTWVDLRVSNGPANRTVTVASRLRSEDTLGVVGTETTEQTPCGDTVRRGTYATSTLEIFTVSTVGFGGIGQPAATAPTATWTVGGVPVTGGSGVVQVPFDGSTFAVDYTIDPVTFELGLTSPGGIRLGADVVCTVADQIGAAIGQTRFEAEGWFEGYNGDDFPKVIACWTRRIKDLDIRVKPGEFEKPTPDPKFDPRDITRLQIEFGDAVVLERAAAAEALQRAETLKVTEGLRIAEQLRAAEALKTAETLKVQEGLRVGESVATRPFDATKVTTVGRLRLENLGVFNR
ncbi:hypothetical protein [Agromyces allii]|uniref:Uncharacterized protein n=1 Tax=Agromyces allii TaxID=393607 RepID=A0ABN2Q3B4_9MICO|nr:hypothetical protein [Agromyces allii]